MSPGNIVSIETYCQKGNKEEKHSFSLIIITQTNSAINKMSKSLQIPSQNKKFPPAVFQFV